jgi:cytochrome c oxidase subunit 2
MRKAARRWPVRTTGILFFVALLSVLSINVAVALDPTGQSPGVTEEANTMHDLYIFVTLLAGSVFLAVEAALVFMIFRFRKKSDELPPQIHGNNVLEIIWTAIPMIIVIGLFVASFIVLIDVEQDADDEALSIDVEGFQFGWNFTYHFGDLGPERSEGDSEETFEIGGPGRDQPTVVIPIGEPVEFRLSSPDVIHSFYVRDFLYKLDVVPGRDNRFTVTANEIGTFEGQCAELCGIDHSVMRFNVQVMSQEDFDAFVAEQREEAQAQAAARDR